MCRPYDLRCLTAMNGIHMGVTAENIAKKYNITREMQDASGYASAEGYRCC